MIPDFYIVAIFRIYIKKQSFYFLDKYWFYIYFPISSLINDFSKLTSKVRAWSTPYK